VVAERARGGRYRDIADLAARSGASRAALRRLAWAGACDGLAETTRAAASPPIVGSDRRREALWEVGGASRAGGATLGAVRARSAGDTTQLALLLDGSPSPTLPELAPWERMVADYEATGMTLARHPMELLRPGLGGRAASSADLEGVGDGRHARVAGLVVARQRPATANGVVFMLLEDEHGMINLVIPPPVAERCRMAIRTSGFVLASGRLERRQGTTNVVVSTIERLRPPEKGSPGAVAQVAAAIPRGTGRDQVIAELEAALPAPHSFGRRGS
jgi:error-prone DNA polymerase